MIKNRNFLAILLSMLILFLNSSYALAGVFSDVSSDYWAYNEIQTLTDEGVISGYPDSTFRPEANVSRAEFTKMVIKAFDKDQDVITTSNQFIDLEEEYWALADILRSAQLDLVVGYPDKSFKPQNNIIKAEATSILANTIKDDNCTAENCCLKSNCKCCSEMNCSIEKGCCCKQPNGGCAISKCILKQFADKHSIARWAKPAYKKTVKNGIYVNHPDPAYLTPQKDLTRAEAAVLLYKIRSNPSLLLAKFQGPELQQRCEMQKNEVPVAEKLLVEENALLVELLPETPYTGQVREVEIQGASAKILADNVIPVKFESQFNGKEYQVGDSVYFVLDRSLMTEEGTKLLPAASRLKGEVVEIEQGRLFHRNGNADISISEVILPNGESFSLEGKIANTEILKRKFGMCNVKKLGVRTLATSAVGTLLGLSIGAMADDAADGAELGVILGSSIGAVLGLSAPGCDLETSADESVYVQLEKPLELGL